MSNYILITPVKNEEDNLPQLIKSVVEQTERPVLWIILNDHSTDTSQDIISEAVSKYDFIIGRMSSGRKNSRDLSFHLSKITQDAIDFAYDYCNENNLRFEFIGNLDADLQLKTDYFKNLREEFDLNPKLGITCGMPLIKDGFKIYPAKYIELPSGGAMFIRKKCFEECGGIPNSYSYDSVLNVKCMLRGWEAKRLRSAEYYSTRYATGADGNWKRYVSLGKGHYYIGYHPFFSLIKSFKMTLKNPYYLGFAYICGFFGSLFRGSQRIEDKDVQNYFRNSKFKEAINRYSRK